MNFVLTNSNTFETENYNDLINTLELFVQYTQSIVQIKAQQSSHMKNPINVWKKNVWKYNIMKLEFEKTKKE